MEREGYFPFLFCVFIHPMIFKKGFPFLSILPLFLFLTSCREEHFELLNQSETNIDFENVITESKTLNVYHYPHLYYGAGIGAADFNNDGLIDLYFVGNQVPGRLYVNKGNMMFEDVTDDSGLYLENSWETGICVVDINQDGLNDIYINVSGPEDSDTTNRLYINKGGMSFVESAAEYGLDFDLQTIQSSFFDYDKDGDLDVFLIVNPSNFNPNTVNNIRQRYINGEGLSTDRLFRNNGDGTFTNVSRDAGILLEGYSLGLAISDINGDGWPDIYVSNDFLSNDVLYINQQNGTFKDMASEFLDHTSFAGMGTSISDLNGDLHPDIVQLDMLPENAYRQKLMLPGNNHKKFNLMLKKGYMPQYTRNTLQLNNGKGTFSEIGFFSGISSTDWSWAPLLADFDNDGHRDIYITNGYLRDMGNLDFVNYMSTSISAFGTAQYKRQKYLEEVAKLNAIAVPNYIYQNQGGLRFKEIGESWGLNRESISHGAVFADLDNDGDQDLIVNNTNEKAFVYENHANALNDNHYLTISLMGKPGNKNGVGAKVLIEHNGARQIYERENVLGYLSSAMIPIHFGVGKDSIIQSVQVHWPDGSFQVKKNVRSDQHLLFTQNEVVPTTKSMPSYLGQNENYAIKIPIKRDTMPSFRHIENPSFDFDRQPLLPRSHSELGPGIAVGDVNQDGLDDFYVGNAYGQPGALFFQTQTGFTVRRVQEDEKIESMGSLFFDADNDSDLDLYLVNGGTHTQGLSERYKDGFYINEGNGRFTKDRDALPGITASGSCVVGADYDRDGDIDLFVGGRVVPGDYPDTPKSYLLKNETDGNAIRFVDVLDDSTDWSGGMVTDALWTDFDNDGWVDLMLVGEFMKITFLKNVAGKLLELNSRALENTYGWWNGITSADYDNDGDTDYIIGNHGLNSRYKSTPEHPITLLANDFDKNGKNDPILCRYIGDTHQISHSRSDLIKQISGMQRRFIDYDTYAKSTVGTSFTKQELRQGKRLLANTLAHIYIENLGGGNFKVKPLPVHTQLSSVYGMISDDFDHDGNMDVMLTGNDYGIEVSTGRLDALKGLFLMGDGHGDFNTVFSDALNSLENAKGIAQLHQRDRTSVISINNDGPLQIFSMDLGDGPVLSLKQNDVRARLIDKQGKIHYKEFYFGGSYLSSSSRKLRPGIAMDRITIYDSGGNKRTIKLNGNEPNKKE